MRFSYPLLLLLCIITFTLQAQDGQPPLLHLGDPAPPLRVRAWLKGVPVERFEKGKVYVVEFWATWCQPCIAAMPHLSTLAREYKDKVTFIGMDVLENKNTSLQKVKAFVDRMGQRMDFSVAAEDSNFMVTSWLEATGERDNGIPRTIVVDKEGRLAWFGHPTELDDMLPKIVNNIWDVTAVAAKRKEDRRIRELDRQVTSKLLEYKADRFKPGSVDQPDSILLAISEMVTKEPKLKYAPVIAFNTFRYLLQTDLNKAYQYGKEVLANRTYEKPAYNAIINNIEWYTDKLNLPPKIYELGGAACQIEIGHVRSPELVNMPKLYNKMADMYWRANNKEKAMDAQQKAIEALKSKQATEMAEFENKLQQYKDM
jgi:thiol-disulfide isomerase/thioredoxin